jgi:hypothetical protein
MKNSRTKLITHAKLNEKLLVSFLKIEDVSPDLA